MEPRISLLTLGVADLERALRFYRDGLGFPTTWSADRGVIFFKTGGVRLALFARDCLARDISEAYVGPPPTFSGLTIAHNVREKAEVDLVLQQATAAGGRIIKPGSDAEWGGYSGYFSDPDGHIWEVAWGAFPFLPDGSLDIP